MSKADIVRCNSTQGKSWTRVRERAIRLCSCVGLIAVTASCTAMRGEGFATTSNLEAAVDLVAADARHHDLPMHSPACDAVDRRLPTKFGIMQTDDFVLFSDAGELQTGQKAQWVERTYQEFQRFADRCGLHPQPLRHKLVCVLFEHRDEYQAFAQTQDGMANPLFTGYYSPQSDRIVFSLDSDATLERNAPPQIEANARDGHTRSVLGFNPQAPRAANNAAAAKCVHETIHQLMFHTRLMSPDVQYPLWICEGLSTAFETNAPDEAFGPDFDFAPRRDEFRSILRDGELMPLRELVTLTQLSGNQPRTTRLVYNQSYALVVWLCRHRADQMRTHLQAMLSEPTGRLSASRHLQLFEQSFGDVDALETQWLASESEHVDSIIPSR